MGLSSMTDRKVSLKELNVIDNYFYITTRCQRKLQFSFCSLIHFMALRTCTVGTTLTLLQYSTITCKQWTSLWKAMNLSILTHAALTSIHSPWVAACKFCTRRSGAHLVFLYWRQNNTIIWNINQRDSFEQQLQFTLREFWGLMTDGTYWRMLPKRVLGTICARHTFIFTWGESTLPGQTGQHIVGSFIGWWQRTGGQLSISHNTPPSWHMHCVHSSNSHVSPSAWYCPSLAWHLVGSPGTNGLLPSEMFQITYQCLISNVTCQFSVWFWFNHLHVLSVSRKKQCTSARRTAIALLYYWVVAFWNRACNQGAHFSSFVAETFSTPIKPRFPILHVASIPWHAPSSTVWSCRWH